MLKKLHHPLGYLVRVRADLVNDFMYRPGVVLIALGSNSDLYTDMRKRRWSVRKSVAASHRPQELFGLDNPIKMPCFLDESPNDCDCDKIQMRLNENNMKWRSLHRTGCLSGQRRWQREQFRRKWWLHSVSKSDSLGRFAQRRGFRPPTLSMLAPFQIIFDEFLLQSVAFWSEISDSCIQIIVNNEYRSNSTWNKKYYTWDIIWKGENRFDNVFQCRKEQYLSSKSFVWNGDLPVHALFSLKN